jgi:hypothetical protein
MMKNLFLGIPQLVVLVTLSIGCANLAGVSDTDERNEPPRGLRRMIRTLETAKVVRSRMGVALQHRVTMHLGPNP